MGYGKKSNSIVRIDNKELDDKFSAQFAERMASVTKQGVKQDGSDESSKIQSCLDNQNFVYFPAGTYFAQGLNITKSNTTILFHPKAVFKFPSNPTGKSIFTIGDLNATTYIQNIKLLGSFTIDATGQPVGLLLRGVYVLGVRHFEINGVLGIGLPDGYPVHVSKSYGTPAVIPEHGEIRHVRSENGSWGTVAVTSGRHIKVENISADYASEAVVDIELDGSGGTDYTENIQVNLVEATNSRAVKITAHTGAVNQIKLTNIRGVHSVANTPATVQLSHETGSLKDISMDNIYAEGGQYAIYTPNDIIVSNLTVEKLHAKNCTINGTHISGGSWENCLVEGCAESGFASTTHTTGLNANSYLDGLKATYTKCVSINNDTSNIGNKPGFYFSHHDTVLLKDCVSYDVNTTKKQRYGVYMLQGNLITERCDFANNLSGAYYIADAMVSASLRSKTIPTGRYKTGVFVGNEDPKQSGTAGAKTFLLGWERLTTGSTNAVGTDWQEVKFNTGN